MNLQLSGKISLKFAFIIRPSSPCRTQLGLNPFCSLQTLIEPRPDVPYLEGTPSVLRFLSDSLISYRVHSIIAQTFLKDMTLKRVSTVIYKAIFHQVLGSLAKHATTQTKMLHKKITRVYILSEIVSKFALAFNNVIILQLNV